MFVFISSRAGKACEIMARGVSEAAELSTATSSRHQLHVCIHFLSFEALAEAPINCNFNKTNQKHLTFTEKKERETIQKHVIFVYYLLPSLLLLLPVVLQRRMKKQNNTREVLACFIYADAFVCAIKKMYSILRAIYCCFATKENINTFFLQPKQESSLRQIAYLLILAACLLRVFNCKDRHHHLQRQRLQQTQADFQE